MPSPSAVAQVVQVLKDATPYGRGCVPVLGSGVNIQAAVYDGLGAEDDWQALLRRIAARVGLTADEFNGLPKSHLAKWETMLRRLAVASRTEPYRAEGVLKTIVCDELRKQEAATKGCSLYGEFLNAGFCDIVSLNFDRRVALHSGCEVFCLGPQGSRGRVGLETVYRHSLIRTDNGRETRIWYPHGDTKKSDTLKLGVRAYGYYLSSLEKHRVRLMSRWRSISARDGQNDTLIAPAAIDKAVRLGRHASPDMTWPMILLVAPLVFIGCGLSSDEWPIWWLLHQRARAFTRFPRDEQPPTIVLTAGSGIPDCMYGEPCNVKVVQFPAHSVMWDVVRGALLDSA